MAIKCVFKLGGDIIEVIYGNEGLIFYDVSSGVATTIEGLKLNRTGVIKEFPDLENDSEWRKKAIDRFKEKVKSFRTEEEVISYIQLELTKYGYQALYKQKAGHRVTKIK